MGHKTKEPRSVIRMSPTHEQVMAWAKQAAQDAVHWAEANANKATDTERQAYGIGFENGYKQAIADLKLHGYLGDSICPNEM